MVTALISISVILFLVINWLAWKQAGAMVFISPAGNRTARIEKLSRLQKFRVLLTGINLPRRLNETTPDSFGLPYEVVRFPGFQGQLEGWLIPSPGAQKLVILFHGYARNKSTLLNEARLLHQMGCACLLVDFPGAGGSQGHRVTLGYYEAVDVMQAATWAKLQFPQMQRLLFGHSMGAASILKAATRFDLQVAGIIIESPFTTLLETVEARFHAMKIPSFPMAYLLLFWGSLRIKHNGFMHKPIEFAKQYSGPVLQMHGRHDPRVPMNRAKAMFNNFPGQKTFVDFEYCEHEPLAAKEPRTWERAVSTFLGTLEAKQRIAA